MTSGVLNLAMGFNTPFKKALKIGSFNIFKIISLMKIIAHGRLSVCVGTAKCFNILGMFLVLYESMRQSCS